MLFDMFKLTVVIVALCIASSNAKPGIIGGHHFVAPAAPLIAAPAPIVTAASSQVIARQYNGIAHTPIVAAPAPPAFAKFIAPAPLAISSHVTPVNKVLSPTSFATSPLGYAAPHDAFGRLLAAPAPVTFAAPYGFPARYAASYSAPAFGPAYSPYSAAYATAPSPYTLEPRLA